MRYLMALFIFMLCSATAFANDSIVRVNGFNAYPIKTDEVRMVAEKISVSMGERGANVTCDFIFENTSGRAIIANVGFPTGSTDTEFGYGGWSLDGFSAYVDGREVGVRQKREIIREWKSKGIFGDDLAEDSEYRNWYTWEVTFPPHGKVHIKNQYSTRYSEDSTGNAWFDYILLTGANWSGNIGETVVELSSADPDRDIGHYVLSAPGFERQGAKLVWTERDFVPTGDIHVTLRNVFLCSSRYYYSAALSELLEAKQYDGAIRLYSIDEIKKLPPRLLSYYKGSGDSCFSDFYPATDYFNELKRQYLRVLRNEIFARHGRIFESEDLARIFKYAKWYEPNPDFSASMLNDMERKNVQLIIDYEKELGYR